MKTGAAGRRLARDSRLPYHVQLKEALEAEMAQGILNPGDLLPSEAELCTQFGVSRTVVRQAIGELESEGRLHRMRGKGTFVAAPKLSEHLLQTPLGFFSDLTASGHVVESKVLKCEQVGANEVIARKLGVEIDEPFVEIDRLRYVNHELTAFAKSFLPMYLDPSLLEHVRDYGLETNSLYTFLEDICGVRIHSGHRFVEAVAATPPLAKLLDVPNKAPLLFIESVARDSTGRAVEHFQAWHRGDRAKLEMDVVRRS